MSEQSMQPEVEKMILTDRQQKLTEFRSKLAQKGVDEKMAGELLTAWEKQNPEHKKLTLKELEQSVDEFIKNINKQIDPKKIEAFDSSCLPNKSRLLLSLSQDTSPTISAIIDMNDRNAAGKTLAEIELIMRKALEDTQNCPFTLNFRVSTQNDLVVDFKKRVI